MIYFTSENILFIGSILVFSAILITKAGYKLGLPTLLVFLLVGMLFGGDGLGVVFDNYYQAQFVGMIALTVILFTGGMETRIKNIRPVMKQGIILSTIGVLLTVIITGLFIAFLSKVCHLPFLPTSMVICFLLAAVMSSTDSATVFNILRNNKIGLKHNLQPTLELESGSNDPMAYVITIVLIGMAKIMLAPDSPEISNETGNILNAETSIEAVKAKIDYWQLWSKAGITLILQIVIGTLSGLGFGYITSWIMQKINLRSSPLYAIMLLSVSFFTFSITGMLHGNGYLAVYLEGLIIGNRYLKNKREIMKFLDGMTWMVQIGMFLVLGLLVNPHDMLKTAPIGLLIGVFIMFIGRPLSVFLCLLPFRKITVKDKVFISWVGLKGAVPIIFATYPVLAGLQGGAQIFNIVFFITLVSMTLQGMTVTKVAKLLSLDLPVAKKTDTFGIHMPKEAGRLEDYTLIEDDLSEGNTLKEISLPDDARVVIIKREERFIVPDGSVQLKEGDQILMINPEDYDDNGIENTDTIDKVKTLEKTE